ncbi:hypothetical protein ACWGKK_24760 [Streptomyces chartreusis]|uniref:hypothetical protein n=1 Tax=Streptomyces TaxID=1883 RepID=UPI0004C8CC34|nr:MULTISPECIES: hypothetical protein [unclassified Streptomyces]SEB76362.1 hypothetical protein SAMN05216482_0829 [Streptomyces sp. PAN_FS17]SEE14224.1 hypothetical protein SAMN05428938_7233 [Streptomyces sp. KS_5]
MRASRTLRTALVAAGVTTALGISAAGALAAPAHIPSMSQHTKAKRVYVTTVKLADEASRAKVYKTGKDRYEAEIWAEGAKYGTLYTQGMPTHAQHNGLHVTLGPDGRVSSWVERAEPKPEPAAERVLIGTSTLADGSTTAKIYRLTADHYEADVYAGGERLDTLVADGRAAYGENDGLHVALHPDGRLASWGDAA